MESYYAPSPPQRWTSGDSQPLYYPSPMPPVTALDHLINTKLN